MTKFIAREQPLGPTIFNFTFSPSNQQNKTICSPRDYKNVELLVRDWQARGDLIFAYDNDRSAGILYRGHWNNGYI